MFVCGVPCFGGMRCGGILCGLSSPLGIHFRCAEVIDDLGSGPGLGPRVGEVMLPAKRLAVHRRRGDRVAALRDRPRQRLKVVFKLIRHLVRPLRSPLLLRRLHSSFVVAVHVVRSWLSTR